MKLPGHQPKLYQQSIARRSIMGHEATMNPTPAQYFLLKQGLGARRAQTGIRRAGRLRRRFHKGNPLPAVVGLLGGQLSHIPVLGGLFKTPVQKRAQKIIGGVVQSALGGNLTAVRCIVERATSTGGAHVGVFKEKQVWIDAMNRLPPALITQMQKAGEKVPHVDHTQPESAAQSALSNPYNPTTGQTAGPSLIQQAGAYLTPQTVTAVARAVTPKRRRSTRSRYPTYVDRYGQQRYSTKPPGAQMRLPAGASIAAGTPYSFFSGAVGKGGAGTTAAQVGVAAAAGTAAYFATQAILKHFGHGVVEKEEAGVQLALAQREARYQYAIAHNLRGNPPTYGVPASVIREMGTAFKAKLAELGYNAQGVRTRSASENFMADYDSE